MGKQKIGMVDHYYNQLQVAVVVLSDTLRVGDKIRVENDLEQKVLEQAVESMQVDYKPVEEAQAGQAVGLHVSEKVHAGNTVYKITLI